MTNNGSLVASNIYHAYDAAAGRIQALENVSFSLGNETFTCLVGPSGCGKSTLLRILAGLIQPESGSVSLNGSTLDSPRRKIGLVFQDATLMPWRTVIQNIMLPLEFTGLSRQEQRRRADSMLALLGLSEFANVYPSALSGGMAQRLAIGRALIYDPEVLLLDEPFGALDALTREYVSEELLRIWSQHKKTVLMVTHSIQEAILLSDRVLVMSPRPGRIVKDVTIDLPRPRSLDDMMGTDFVRLEAQVRAALRR